MICLLSYRWEAAHDVRLTYRAYYVTACIIGLFNCKSQEGLAPAAFGSLPWPLLS